jgi:hypothetical protein
MPLVVVGSHVRTAEKIFIEEQKIVAEEMG